MTYIGYKAHDIGFDAHLTVLFMGLEEIDAREQIAIQQELTEHFKSTEVVFRKDIQMFGPENDIPVLTIHPTVAMINLRIHLANKYGNKSQFKEWNPHITLDFDHTETIHLPWSIRLTDLGVYN